MGQRQADATAWEAKFQGLSEAQDQTIAVLSAKLDAIEAAFKSGKVRDVLFSHLRQFAIRGWNQVGFSIETELRALLSPAS